MIKALVRWSGVTLWLGLAALAAGEVRTWTDVSGKYRYEAEFVGMEGSVVKLKLADEKVARIPFEKLSEGDRERVVEQMKLKGWKLVEEPVPALEIEESPKPRKHTQTAAHFSELLKKPGKKNKLRALEGLGKIYVESLDRAEQEEGVKLLARIKELGDHEAWDEASSTIARYYIENLRWEEAEKAWFDYVSDKNTGRYSAEAWAMLGVVREKVAGDDNDKLRGASSAYLQCFAKYKNQVKYSSLAWRNAAELEFKLGEKERARKLLDMMIAELGGLADITDTKKRTDDVKWAQIQLNIAKQLREKW